MGSETGIWIEDRHDDSVVFVVLSVENSGNVEYSFSTIEDAIVSAKSPPTIDARTVHKRRKRQRKRIRKRVRLLRDNLKNLLAHAHAYAEGHLQLRPHPYPQYNQGEFVQRADLSMDGRTVSDRQHHRLPQLQSPRRFQSSVPGVSELKELSPSLSPSPSSSPRRPAQLAKRPALIPSLVTQRQRVLAAEKSKVWLP